MRTEAQTHFELSEFMLRCQGQIQTYGCVVVTLPGDRRAKKPALAYTVGLTERFRHAELLVFGLTRDASLIIIGELMRIYVRPGFGVPLNESLPRAIAELPLVAKSTTLERAKSYARIAYARCNQVKQRCHIHQLVWPDARNHFPWEAGYDARYTKIQPQLFDLQ